MTKQNKAIIFKTKSKKKSLWGERWGWKAEGEERGGRKAKKKEKIYDLTQGIHILFAKLQI